MTQDSKSSSFFLSTETTKGAYALPSAASPAIPGFRLPGWQEQVNYAALLVLLVRWTGHVWGTWGEITYYWGNYGLWLHQLERFVHGEALYRDFNWPYPPLSVWFVGGVERVIGSDLNAVRAVTVSLSLAICAAFFLYASQLTPRSLMPWITAACFLLSSGLSVSPHSNPFCISHVAPCEAVRCAVGRHHLWLVHPE